MDSEFGFGKTFVLCRGIYMPLLAFLLRGAQIGDPTEFCLVVSGLQLVFAVVPFFLPKDWKEPFFGWETPTEPWVLWTLSGILGWFSMSGFFHRDGDLYWLGLGSIFLIEGQILLRVFYPMFDEQRWEEKLRTESLRREIARRYNRY